MSVLITLVLFGIITSIFATQNSGLVTVNLAGNVISPIPLYVLVLLSMLIGLFMGWVVNILSGLFHALNLYKKNQTIKSSHKEVEQLKEKLRLLEVENLKLKSEASEVVVNTSPRLSRS